MTLNEFKAWFEGFSEGIDKVPSEKQFAKIKDKVAEINDTPVTRQYFIERYPNWPHVNQPWWQNPVTSTMDVGDRFYGGMTAAMRAAGELDAAAA